MSQNDLSALIGSHYDFADYVDDPALLDDLPLAAQRELAAAYLRDNPTDFAEFTDFLAAQDHVIEAMASIVAGEVDGDAMYEFSRVAGDAAIEAFRDGINARLEREREAFFAEHGCFEADSAHGPGGLIGLRRSA